MQQQPLIKFCSRDDQLGSEFTVRSLLPDEWTLVRDIRLEALAMGYGRFGRTVADEISNTEADWRDWLIPEGKCVIGLFDGKDIIGMTAVIPWSINILPVKLAENWLDRPHEKTAYVFSTYVRRNYKRLRPSSLIYKFTLDWIAAQGSYRRVTAAHRATNSVVGNILRKYHFFPIERRPFKWADNVTEDILIYLLDLRINEKN